MISKLVWAMCMVSVLGLASSAAATFDPSEDMIIHYRFNGNVLNMATGPSSAGAAGNGVLSGGSFVPGLFGDALYFDGSSTHVDVDDNVLGNFRNRTIMVWAERETVDGVSAPGGRRKIFAARGGNYRMDAMTWNEADIGPDEDFIGFNAAGGGVEGPSPVGPVNQWIHYAIVIEDNGALADATYYVNGNFFGQRTGLPQHNQVSLEGFMIGMQSFAGNQERWWGAMDEFRIYDRVLTPCEIQAVMLVPEPTTALLVLVGMGALALRRRK